MATKKAPAKKAAPKVKAGTGKKAAPTKATASTPPKRPHGRPSTYTPEVADAILKRLSTGEPLAVICRDEGMPAVRTVSDWKAAHPDFSAAFARARDDGFDALAAQCLEISDNESHDWSLTKKGLVVSETAIGRARLQVETRLKLLAKWDPKRYGERTTLAGDAENPLALTLMNQIAASPNSRLKI